MKKGKLSQAAMDKCMSLITPTLDYNDIADCDLVIEAVFETMSIKKEVFNKLDEVCKQGAILASNTSTLNVDEIAACTKRPEDVIGLHFFAPANVMTLLEIVRGAKTAKDVVATSMAMAKTIRKMGVLVRVCFGFVGNRMFFPYVREAQRMILEGIPTERIDQVAYDWGMAMGPFTMNDMAGLWAHPQLKSRDRWRDVGSPVGMLPALLPPGRNSAFDYRMDPIPKVGEHTDAILQELGLSSEAVQALRAAQAI